MVCCREDPDQAASLGPNCVLRTICPITLNFRIKFDYGFIVLIMAKSILQYGSNFVEMS